MLPADHEGGGGTGARPWAFAEAGGMCKYKANDPENDGLSVSYKPGGTRYGGSVQVEEFGHTIFDISMSYFDPQGWKAVQYAAKKARYYSPKRTPPPGWDCFTSATEYFAAGVELLLYNT